MTSIPDVIERVLALSKADHCIVIARRGSSVNVRWATNTVTTNGSTDGAALSIVSIKDGRVGSVTKTYFPDDTLESLVRESEADCENKPEAPDRMPLLDGSSTPSDWDAEAAATDIGVFERVAPELAETFERARAAGIETFGYAEHEASTTWLATSTGIRLRHSDRIGKFEITGKTPDYQRSSWVGAATEDFSDIACGPMFDRLEERLAWSERKIELPPGAYEVVLDPSCTADLALSAYYSMIRRDADEGRSPYAKPGGGSRLGERMFGDATLYSDPAEPGIGTAPFHAGIGSSGATSVFDNGLPLRRTDWVRDGELRQLITPRYWAAKVDAGDAVPYIDNIVVPGQGPSLDEMIEQTGRALLVTCFWYIRTVDPQTALQTGLTRDGVFLVENGEVVGAVNNFRWNMSPIAAFAQATQIGASGPALPRENDEFLRAKAPPMRVDRFNMSSVSEAT